MLAFCERSFHFVWLVLLFTFAHRQLSSKRHTMAYTYYTLYTHKVNLAKNVCMQCVDIMNVSRSTALLIHEKLLRDYDFRLSFSTSFSGGIFAWCCVNALNADIMSFCIVSMSLCVCLIQRVVDFYTTFRNEKKNNSNGW